MECLFWHVQNQISLEYIAPTDTNCEKSHYDKKIKMFKFELVTMVL